MHKASKPGCAPAKDFAVFIPVSLLGGGIGTEGDGGMESPGTASQESP